MPEVTAWQHRPLETVYHFVFLDAVHYKGKADHRYQTKAAYVVLGVTMDGMKGLVEANRGVYPHSQVQRCIVHQICSFTRFVSCTDIKPLMADLKKVCTAVTEDETLENLMAFKRKAGQTMPLLCQKLGG